MAKKKFRRIFLILVICLNCINICSASFHNNLELSTESIILVNTDTNSIVFEKNVDAKRSPASLTKIMTYIVVAENTSDYETKNVFISQDIIKSLNGTGSSMSNIKPNQMLSIKQLLNAMMIPSGNDAALVLATYIGQGNISNFVEKMNAKAAELGLENTHFNNPHGLFDENHYTSARDMYKITTYALNLPYFQEITNSVTSNIIGDGAPLLITTNSMIDKNRGGQYYYKYARGIKTGHLDQSGYCIVTTAKKSDTSYMCVAMGAPSKDETGKKISTNGAMIDFKNLCEWSFNNLKLKTILNDDTPITEIKVKYMWGKDSVMLVPTSSFSLIVPKDVLASSINIIPNVPQILKDSKQPGDIIGTADLFYANEKIGSIDLTVSEPIKTSFLLWLLDIVKSVFASTVFLITISIVIFLIVLYTIFTYTRNKKAYRRKTKMKFKKNK